MGSSIIPLSIDDEVASTKGCDIACMAFPYLLCIGWTLVFAALFSKMVSSNITYHFMLPRFLMLHPIHFLQVASQQTIQQSFNAACQDHCKRCHKAITRLAFCQYCGAWSVDRTESIGVGEGGH